MARELLLFVKNIIGKARQPSDQLNGLWSQARRPERNDCDWIFWQSMWWHLNVSVLHIIGADEGSKDGFQARHDFGMFARNATWGGGQLAHGGRMN